MTNNTIASANMNGYMQPTQNKNKQLSGLTNIINDIKFTGSINDDNASIHKKSVYNRLYQLA